MMQSMYYLLMTLLRDDNAMRIRRLVKFGDAYCNIKY